MNNALLVLQAPVVVNVTATLQIDDRVFTEIQK